MTIYKATELFPGDDRAEFHLISPQTGIVINNDGVTWTKIPNMVGDQLIGFTASGGTLTKTGDLGTFRIVGTSNAAVNKAVTIYYGLSINGAIPVHEVTPHTFGAASKTETLAITSMPEINPDDDIEVWVKGDGIAINVTLDVYNLDVTFGLMKT